MSIGCDILQGSVQFAMPNSLGEMYISPITYQRVAASGNRNMMEEEANSAKVLCTCVRGKHLKLLLTSCFLL